MSTLQWALWLAVAAYCGGIWWLSSGGPEVTARADATGVPDFYLHLILFAGLSLLVRLALGVTWPAQPASWLAVVTVGGVVLYGVVDEVHQHYVPGRGMGLDDLLGDAAGAILIQLLVALALWCRPLFW